MSPIKRSGSLTENASPLGSQATMEESSFLSISMSLRGNGLEPELPPLELCPGAEAADKAGERACDLAAANTLLFDDAVRVDRPRVVICVVSGGVSIAAELTGTETIPGLIELPIGASSTALFDLLDAFSSGF